MTSKHKCFCLACVPAPGCKIKKLESERKKYKKALEKIKTIVPDFKTYFNRNNVSVTQNKWKEVSEITEKALGGKK